MVNTLAPVLREHPGLVLDLRLSDVIADVVEEQIDVGIRIGPMRDSRFVAREAAKAILLVVGTPDLESRVGLPNAVDDLHHKPLTLMIDNNTERPWPWPFKGRKLTGFSNTEETQVGLAANAPWLLEDRLVAGGALFEAGAPWAPYVVVDGNLVTGQNPASAASTTQAFLNAIAERR